MPRFAAWEFGDEAKFDGRSLFAEAVPEAERALRIGALELVVTPTAMHRATILSHGVPGRDASGFTIAMGQSGAIRLCGTDRSGMPLRLSSRDGLVSAGERVQITISWMMGEGGRFSVVNCDRLRKEPGNPDHAFVAPVPLRASIGATGGTSLTFGAAEGGVAPFFEGDIHRVTLSDTADAPTIAPPTARILRPAFGAKTAVAPRRVASRTPLPVQPRMPEPRNSVGRMAVTTADGLRPAETLQVGDEVMTRNNGLQKIRWIARVDLDWSTLRDRPQLRPIVIRKGALGHGLPEADLALAPNHRLMVGRDAPIEEIPAEDRLVSARSLLGSRGVFEVDALGVTYVHLLFDQHEMIEANGVWTEAFHPGEMLRQSGDVARRAEVLEIFPELNAETHPASR